MLAIKVLFRKSNDRLPGAINIPLSELRTRLSELPREREILVIYRSGRRACDATRMLMQNGFKVRNLAGGMLSRSHLVSPVFKINRIPAIECMARKRNWLAINLTAPAGLSLQRSLHRSM